MAVANENPKDILYQHWKLFVLLVKEKNFFCVDRQRMVSAVFLSLGLR